MYLVEIVIFLVFGIFRHLGCDIFHFPDFLCSQSSKQISRYNPKLPSNRGLNGKLTSQTPISLERASSIEVGKRIVWFFDTRWIPPHPPLQP